MPVSTTHKATIYVAALKVDPDPIPLNKTNEDDLDWFSSDDDASVIFKAGTPFTEAQFEVPKGKTTHSGPLKSVKDGLRICKMCTPDKHQPGHPEHYKYEVWSHGLMKMDPEIIIVKST